MKFYVVIYECLRCFLHVTHSLLQGHSHLKPPFSKAQISVLTLSRSQSLTPGPHLLRRRVYLESHKEHKPAEIYM